jgi:D-glycero-beta-D-manno-heptose-7-phosphate kinase
VNTKQLKALFESFSSFNILVIGDVMIDSYLWGKVERISPEAPVPVVSIINRENRLGGAANVALNLRSLGAKPIICAITGNDEQGKLFVKLCNENKISTKGIIVLEDRPTTVKTRVIGGNQHLLRVDEEISKEINQTDTNSLSNQILSILKKEKIHAIIFEDYDKGTITPALIKNIIQIAKQKHIPVCVDPKKRNFLAYENVSLFKPNFRELNEGLKLDLKKKDFKEIFKACKQFQKVKKIDELMVTLSELGLFISDSKSFHTIPTQVRDVADVSGAGDTVISVATLCKAAGLNATETAAISNIAGGLVCEKVGVVPIEKQALSDACIQYFNKKK